MDKLRKHSKSAAWVYALFVNALFLTFFANTCTIRFRTNDDWSVANYISGVRGREFATPYIKFVNILLTKPLYYLYQIYHDINWFAVIEETIIFLSMAVLVYVMVRQLLAHGGGSLAFILPFFFVGAFSATFYCRMQYTQTASVGAFSGFLLILFSYRYDGCKINMDKVAGMALTGLSALFRPSCFLLILPFVLILILDYAVIPFIRTVIKDGWQQRKSLFGYISAFISQYRKIILLFSLIMIAYAGIYFVQKWVNHSERYDDYRVFNTARAHFIDYEQYDYDRIADELTELGVSRNDYALMQLWTFGDADFITAELLQSIVELQPVHAGSFRELLVSYVKGYARRIFIGIYFFTLAALILLALTGKKGRMYSAALYILLHALDFYFCVIVGRYPYWLMSGVLYSAIGTSVYLADLSGICSMKKYAQVMLAMGLGIMLFPFGNEWYVENFNSFEYEYSGVRLYEYLNEREGDVFYVPTKNSGMPSLMNGYSVFQTVREGTSRNTVNLGGWATGHPDVVRSYHELGIYSALQQIDRENVYLFSQKEFIELYQTYLYEHTGRTGTYSLTNEKFGASIYKITSDMGGGTVQEIYMENVDHGYNSDFDLYEIDVQASVGSSLTGRAYDVYLAVEDGESGDRRFFMCYDAEKTQFENTEQAIMLKALIPDEYIEDEKTYRVSIVLTDEDDNRYYTDDCRQIERVNVHADN